MQKNIIVAVADNGAIGKDNSLLWHISEDLGYFKSVTLGSPVIMGRKTFESIGRPLPKRTNIVVTRGDVMTGPDGSGMPFPDGVLVAHSLEEAFAMAEMPAVRNLASIPGIKGGDSLSGHSCFTSGDMAAADDEAGCFVIGGGEIYSQAIDYADRLYVTEVHTSIEDADTFFPAIDPAVWEVSSRSEMKSDPETGLAFEFVVYHRR
ncbi:MAG: dihydrofolate reductase [Clostridium sp.]|nr:dihydrofolate reductase [Bacteroides sp.]MCM1198026.1 dihydrofolate reductase [Clostridium sp.]